MARLKQAGHKGVVYGCELDVLLGDCSVVSWMLVQTDFCKLPVWFIPAAVRIGQVRDYLIGMHLAESEAMELQVRALEAGWKVILEPVGGPRRSFTVREFRR